MLPVLFFLSLGCVDFEPPGGWKHSDGGTAGRPAGRSGSNGLTRGTGSRPAPDGGGSDPAGGASAGTPVDAGASGTTIASSAGDALSPGGNTASNPPIDGPQATGGVVAGAGASGSGKGETGGRSGTSGPVGAAGATGAVPADTGVPDAAPAVDSYSPVSRCQLCDLSAALVHRYSFEGTGTKVTDSVGTAHGTVVQAQLSGQGTLVLAGGSSGQYVDLPDKILSKLGSATLEVWVTWNGGNSNQRILDFGSNGQANGKIVATTTVLISPNSAPDQIPPRLRASYSKQVSHTGIFVDAPNPMPTGAMKQIVAVLDGQSRTITMYLNGGLQGQASGIEALSMINDNNNWLGKSQYSDDPYFSGTYYELRIYNAPLTAPQIQDLYAAGPGATFDK